MIIPTAIKAMISAIFDIVLEPFFSFLLVTLSKTAGFIVCIQTYNKYKRKYDNKFTEYGVVGFYIGHMFVLYHPRAEF
jgi:hypothetical protein